MGARANQISVGRSVGNGGLTAAERDLILRRYVAGETGAKLAKEFGVSESYPAVLAKRMNVQRSEPPPKLRLVSEEPEDYYEDPAPVPRPSVIPCVEPNEVLRLHARGVGLTGIAALTRLTYAQIRSIVDRAKACG